MNRALDNTAFPLHSIAPIRVDQRTCHLKIGISKETLYPRMLQK